MVGYDERTPGSIFRPRWFLLTRFFAVAGAAGALLAARYVFRIETIRYPALWMLAGILLFSNLAYCAYWRFVLRPMGTDGAAARLTVFTAVQITSDLVILTLMLHYGGGAANPFVLYYFFHTMLASILLPKRLAYLEAGTATALFTLMTVLEGIGAIPHYDLMWHGAHGSPAFMIGVCAALGSALFIAVYMAEAIMDPLRAHQRALERALAETERLEAEKSRFLEVVAHDLKSPLASIETMVTSALAVHGTRIPPEVKKMMERIPVRTGELLRFIKELLEFSKIRSTTDISSTFEPVDLRALAAEAVDRHMSLAAAKHIALEARLSADVPAVRGNGELLGRMLANLVSNAVRYTPENGAVTVTAERNGVDAVIEVRDTGIGIPEEDLGRVFTDFFRAANARRFTPTGTGLGLSIVRSAAEAHGGTVAVQSAVGAGTTFTVRIPALHPAEADAVRS